MAKAGACSVAGCVGEFHAKGLCHIHYKQALRSGVIVRTEFDNSGPCAVEGCRRGAHSKGLCKSHYSRARKRGAAVAPVEESPKRYMAEVVLPFVGDECLIWPFGRNRQGYAGFRSEHGQFACRHICTVKHGPPPTPKHESAHSCGRGHLGCVNPGHLRWATKAENQKDRELHGTSARGKPRHSFKRSTRLTEDTVRQIGRLNGTGSQQAIADKFGVSRRTVGDIWNGRRRAA